jgi:hypothetical protein
MVSDIRTLSHDAGQVGTWRVRFTLEVEMTAEAFKQPGALAAILDHVADAVADPDGLTGTTAAVRDSYGANVGCWEIR